MKKDKQKDNEAAPAEAPPPQAPSALHGPSPVLEPLLGVHSAPDAAWLVDSVTTAAERGLGALYSLLYLSDASTKLSWERPASSERMRAMAKLNQELGVNLTGMKLDTEELGAVRFTLEDGRAKIIDDLGEALGVSLDGKAQRRLGIGEVWLVPLQWSGESQGVLVLLMPGDPSAPLELAELMGRHIAVALKNVRDKEAGRKRGELDAVRWVYDEQRFNEQLAKEISRGQRHKRALSVLLLRVDNVQELRTRYGRFLTERLLRQIGVTMEETMRYTDFLGAYNDDGFACILVEADQTAAERARERMLEALEKVVLPRVDLPDFHLELSCATATLAVDGEAGPELIAAAQQRLDPTKEQDVA